MTPRIFAYIAHKGGVADDSAAELLAAAKKIDAGAPPAAVVTGWGAELDAVCESLRGSYGEVWKVASESLAYPSLTLARIASAMFYTPSKIRKSNHPSGSQMRFWAHQKYMQKSIKGNTASHSGVNTLAKREQHNKKLTSPTQALQMHSSKPPRQTESG